MFIHWGVYSVLGDGEWVMNNQKIPVSRVREAAAAVQSHRVRRRRMGGAGQGGGHEVHHHHQQAPRRLRHVRHEAIDWNIVDRTPYGKDVLKMLADECQQAGHQALLLSLAARLAPPRLLPARAHAATTAGRPEAATGTSISITWMRSSPSCSRTTATSAASGSTACGTSPQADWRLATNLRPDPPPAARRARSAATITCSPSRAKTSRCSRKTCPDTATQASTRVRKSARCRSRPARPSTTPGATTRTTDNFKSTTDLIHYLVRAAGYDANFLLNVGPMPNGKIQPEFVERLQAMGDWLD